MSDKLTLETVINHINKITKEDDESEEEVINEIQELKLLSLWETEFLHNLPNELKEFVNPYEDIYYRNGMLKKQRGLNISFLCSLLFMIKDDFMNMASHDKIVYINKLINELYMDLEKGKL